METEQLFSLFTIATFTLLEFKCQIVISFLTDIIIKASKSIFLIILI